MTPMKGKNSASENVLNPEQKLQQLEKEVYVFKSKGKESQEYRWINNELQVYSFPQNPARWRGIGWRH